LAPGWTRPIRFLWIDGDHTYRGRKRISISFARISSPARSSALHDVLHTFEGPVRVFAEELLDSDRFGPAGLCGSIGWAQYRRVTAESGATSGAHCAATSGGCFPREGWKRADGLAEAALQVVAGARAPRGPDAAAWVRAVS